MTNTGGKNTKMKRLLKNKKALSPVVAAIILIAVTVAVSIAVAAWMGSMTFTFMETEELKITSMTYASDGTLTVNVRNTGTSDVIIVGANLNDQVGTMADDETILAGGPDTFDVTGLTYSEGVAYRLTLLSS